MRTIYRLCSLSLLLLLGAIFWGCSSANSNAPSIDPATGKHPAGWIEAHWIQYLKNTDQCKSCHGTDLRGGIAQTSCFSANIGTQACHANGPAGHPLDWPRPELHGIAAMGAPGTMSGYTTCQACHGSDYQGNSSQVGCFSCHTKAPHPDAPWLSTTLTHTTTNQLNAPACAGCHLNNARLTVPLAVPAGTTPGCFNNTLCHGASGHPAGWADPLQHGVAAKDASGPGKGFSSCQSCHGSDFKGSGSAVSCFSCHATAPHSPAPWRIFTGSPSTRTHTDTNTQNAATCGLCHLNNARLATPVQVPAGVTPGCFNGTLCHGSTTVPHAVPFQSSALHGPPAKADLVFCQGCHGQAGGAGSNPRFNVSIGALPAGCETCHKTSTAHPAPSSGYTFWAGHQSAGNMANACTLCHGASLGGGIGPSCTSCHTAGSPLVKTNCSSCHGNPPPDPLEGNLTHREHNSIAPNLTGQCNNCHNGSGSGTPNHFNGVKNVTFLPAFNARSGTATYNATTAVCANISCHGGVPTPPWKVGFINVSTECASCHIAGTTQYNGYFSGRHSLHVNSIGLACTVCHDTAKLASPTPPSHFSNLYTTTFELAPSLTLRNVLQYSGGSCTPNQAPGNFPIGCHGSENW